MRQRAASVARRCPARSRPQDRRPDLPLSRLRSGKSRRNRRTRSPARQNRPAMPNELLLTAPRTIGFAPYEDPPPQADQALAEAIVSGISHGTELALYRGASPFHGKRFDVDLRLLEDDADAEAYPMRLGYEWVGRVR